MSSGGARLQIIAQGKQDVYITGNPQRTFFKVIYARHTAFAIESKALMFDGTPNFGQRITCLIPKNGDLLSKLYLEIKLPQVLDTSSNPVPYVHNIGHAIIKEISFQIGEQEIDRQTGEWMEMSSRLSTSLDKREALDTLIGAGEKTGPLTVTVPLRFWFCDNYGLSLPLCALQYHPLRLNIKLRPLEELLAFNVTKPTTCDGPNIKTPMNPAFVLWADYVHLDVEELRRFAKNDHEYLIDQVQYTPAVSVPEKTDRISIPIDFNHPVKELLWVIHRNAIKARNEWFNWSSHSKYDISAGTVLTDNMVEATLMIDGKERFENRDGTYFRLIQPYQHHTRVDPNYYIYAYSFALKPEEFQPSGSLNMSLMNTVSLNLSLVSTAAPMTVTVYGHNLNILRITNGLGGLLFKV